MNEWTNKLYLNGIKTFLDLNHYIEINQNRGGLCSTVDSCGLMMMMKSNKPDYSNSHILLFVRKLSLFSHRVTSNMLSNQIKSINFKWASEIHFWINKNNTNKNNEATVPVTRNNNRESTFSTTKSFYPFFSIDIHALPFQSSNAKVLIFMEKNGQETPWKLLNNTFIWIPSLCIVNKLVYDYLLIDD